ncbi:PBECR2 nuclease fold domain-containing protein [Candidatus Methylocalor cossyra]|uniref:Phage head morphogenesis protein n=1 Tax=Candidatus Methylocalor cossyra TaxID=3108543 RepID=A0ABM9NL05_9GAMM
MAKLDPADFRAIFRLEPKAAVAYLKRKGYKLSWNWQEMLDEAHARGFTVAKVARLDVLQDIRAAVEAALKEGQTFREFQQNLTPVLQAKGWWGKQIIVDSQGKAEVARLGSPARLKTIYQTNLQSAYMAGRYQAMVEATDSHPYWEYVAVLDSRTRPSHRAMNGRVFRHDDPIWNVAWPPCGFNCRCRVRPRSERSLERDKIAWQSSAGKLRTIEVDAGVDKRTGEITRAKRTGLDLVDAKGKPVFFAPDAGFNFNAGRDWAKPFTPPPLDTLPRTFPPGQALPPLPKPERLKANAILPDDLTPSDYAMAFLLEFGAEIDKPVIFKDVVGEPLTIDVALFQDGAGQWKAAKDGRGPYMRLLAKAVREPDEIWLRWEESRDRPGLWLLKRRYIKTFEIEGMGRQSPQYGLSVFEAGKDGWSGSTTMLSQSDRGPESRRRYIERQRDGFLQYRKN